MTPNQIMKVVFRKKRGLCTLLLILYCGSSWSLNQRITRSELPETQRCPRIQFTDLWTTETLRTSCSFDEIHNEEAARIEQTLNEAEIVLNSTPDRVRLDAENVNESFNEGREDHSEPTFATSTQNSNFITHSTLIPDKNQSDEIAVSNETLSQSVVDESSTDNNGTRINDDRIADNKKNDTENATASILNGSIIQDKEAMPSFDEWKKIRLEQEMHDPASPLSPKESEHRDMTKAAERKRGRRNYASIECGAKLVSANPGAEGASKVLLEAKDEYMLNPCNSLQKEGMFFIVELCESIHPTHIELANYELYSSTGKEFVVYMSDHYQSREWTQIGKYEMAHLKTVQSFPLDAPGFGKVIKVEFLSIYENNQYYCPLSLVRVFGNSMVDDYEEKVSEDSKPDNSVRPVEPEVVVEPTPVVTVTVDQNMVSIAKQAVINIISSVSKAVSGTQLPDGNCTDCVSNDSNKDSSMFVQQFNNCFFDVSNLSGLEGHLWPSMKCRFAEVANVHRSCRPLAHLGDPIRIEPSSIKFVEHFVNSVTASSSAAPIVPKTVISDLIEPTTVSDADRMKEMKTSTLIPVKPTQDVKKDVEPSPEPAQPQQQNVKQPELQQNQQHPNVASKDEKVTTETADNVPGQIAKPSTPNVKIPPLSHINPIPLPGTPNVAKNANPTNQATKENLFSRFENRIKQLELNMNLSGTYLEELSKRYRNQMEEMQAAFNKTVAALNMEAKRGLERDQNQQQALAALQERLTAVSESLRILEIESDSRWWRLLLVYLGSLVASITIFVVLFQVILRRTIASYVWSANIEKRMLELLERDRRIAQLEQQLYHEQQLSQQKGHEQEDKPQLVADSEKVKQEEAISHSSVKTETPEEPLESMDHLKTEPQNSHTSQPVIVKSPSAPEFSSIRGNSRHEPRVNSKPPWNENCTPSLCTEYRC